MLLVPSQAGCTLGFQEERTVVPLSVARVFGRPGAGGKELLGVSSLLLAWLCAGDGWNVERVCGILLFIAYFFFKLNIS